MPAVPPDQQNASNPTHSFKEHTYSKEKSTQQFSPPLRKLDGRLLHLYQWATQKNYHHMWDLCCDHGRLGLHLHRAPGHTQSHIHLIDQVPDIIQALKTKCAHIAKDRLSICTMDASHIQLAPANHLIILAGIGGKNAVEIIKKLLVNNNVAHQNSSTKAVKNAAQTINIDLLLSPTNHIYTLRQYLHSAPFHCVEEEFIHEKGQDYEHLFYRLNTSTIVQNTPEQNPAGSSIWQPMTSQKERYLKKIINHYQSCQAPSKEITQAFKHYQLALNAAAPPR